jgi:hypothetical protein
MPCGEKIMDAFTYDVSEKVVVTASVPCGSCTICCQNNLIFLHPECGDVLENYEHEPAPKQFPERFVLKRLPGGDCVYLDRGVGGCIIHDRAPAICREFDCRAFAKRVGYTQGRKLVKAGLLTKRLLNRGRQLNREGK